MKTHEYKRKQQEHFGKDPELKKSNLLDRFVRVVRVVRFVRVVRVVRLVKMFQKSQVIEIDATDIKFCCGPCCSTHPEPEPTWLGTEYQYVFKPYDGKKYAPFNWPLPNNGKIVVKNLRVCDGCHRRYNDDEFDEEDLIRDGLTVLDKLKNHANI